MGSSITIKDVAQKAAVSVGTVSKYLNGFPCSPARTARIREAIKLLNYKRNPFARSTRTSKSYCVGLVVESSVKKNDTLWIEGWLSSLLYVLSLNGYRGVVFLVDSQKEDFSPEIFDNVVDGLITFGLFHNSFWEKMRTDCTLPLVTYLEQVPYEYGFSFPVAMEEAFQKLAENFYFSGHRHIAVIGQPEKTFRKKAEIFINAFRSLGAQDGQVEFLVTDYSTSQMEQGYLLTKRVLQDHKQVSGIFYSTDNLACRGLCALMEYHKAIPQDMSVASYDHSAWAENFYPSLSGVGIGHDNLAGLLVDYLCARLAGETEKVTRLQQESLRLLYYPGKSILKIAGKSDQ